MSSHLIVSSGEGSTTELSPTPSSSATILCSLFVGWWLSMKNEDCFLNRIQPLGDWTRLMQKDERFGGKNEKTLGFLVVCFYSTTVMLSSNN